MATHKQENCKFIVLEGPHCSGKTTIATLLVRHFLKLDIPSIYTREPFSKELSEQIKRFASKEEPNKLALAFLIFADRSIHASKIREWISDGVLVVCDRYIQSSFVYQRIDGVNHGLITECNSEFPRPDLTVFVRTPLRVRKKRMKEKYGKNPRHRFLTPSNVLKEEKLYQHMIGSSDSNSTIVSGTGRVQNSLGKIVSIVQR